jgi:hypothetical protein
MRTQLLSMLVVFGLVQGSYTLRADADEWGDWRAAQEAAQAGDFADAEKQLRAAPQESANFHYNLGTIAARQGKWGIAVAHLEKANHLRPHHSSTQNNLRIARRSLARSGGPAEADLDRASTWLESVADQVALNEVRAVLGMIGILLAFVWMRQYRKTRSLRATFFQPAGLIAMVALLITATLYAAERLASSHPAAVVLDSIVIRSGPGAQFTELAKLDAGIKIRVTGTRDQDWLQVRYGPREIGWVSASSLLLL